MAQGPVRITRSLRGSSGFARAVEAAAAEQAYRQLKTLVDEAAAEAKRIVSSELVNDRPPLRRKKGARHLLGGIKVELDFPNGVNTFPIIMTGKVIGDQKKTAALEFGSPGHPINAVNAPFLVFPSSGDARSTKTAGDGSIIRLESGKASKRQRAQGLANNNRLSRQKLVKAKSVDHPGNRPYRFLQRGMERAIRAAFK